MTEAAETSSQARQPERLQLGTLIVEIESDPGAAGPACGRWILAAGGSLPRQRWTRYDLLFCVFGGQGRLVVGEERTTLVPGVAMRLPRDQWWQLQNTGTGAIKLFWVCTPQGIEAYFRETAGAGGDAAAERMAAIRAEHGIEVDTTLPVEAPTIGPPGPRAARRRGGRRRGRRPDHPAPAAHPSAQQTPMPAAPASAAVAEQPTAPEASGPAAPPGEVKPQREWRRRRRSRGRPHAPAAGTGPAQTQPAGGQAQSPPPAAEAHPQPPSAGPKREGQRPGGQRRRDSGRRRGPRGFREVYMDGRWVKVRGEGPVISGA